MSEQFETYTMPNGVRLIHCHSRSEVAHFGLLVHTGTRDEKEEEHGLAHFMEHMFFKGTPKRTAYQIISRLEDVGGEINAYTTKEETAIYASFLKGDIRKAVELMQDIFLNSKFDLKDRKKEAEVIYNEIQNYEDTPSELIFDHSEELLFPDHSIGRNILGTKESLLRFQNGLVEHFRLENYSTEELVLCSVGDIPFAKMKDYANTFFHDLPSKSRIRPRIEPAVETGKEIIRKRNTYQTHCILSGKAYSYQDEKRIALHLLNNILGGPGMNSRLNMALRERRGYSYSSESHYITYTDSGALNIYFSSDRERFAKSLEIVRKEMSRLRETLIPLKRLQDARRQLLGQIAISSENGEHLMLSIGKSYLIFNQVDTLKDIEQKLNSVSAETLREVANEVLDPKLQNVLIYQ